MTKRGNRKFVNYFKNNKQPSFKNKHIKNVRNYAHLSDDYLQNLAEMSNNLVNDELTKKRGSVNTISMTDIVRGLKGAKFVYIRIFASLFISMDLTRFLKHNKWFSLSREKKTFNPLSASPTKWSNTLKQYVGYYRRTVWVCLTIL